jgi:hypothetical protein
MEKEIRYRVRGLRDADTAQRVEAYLHSKVGIHEVQADPESGELWLRYDSVRVPPPRLKDYLSGAGVTPL